MLFLAHVQGESIGLSVGGLAVINKSFFLTVSKKQLVCLLTLGHTRKLIPTPWYKGGGGGGRGRWQLLPWVFAVLQYLGNNLRLTDSLSCGLQCKVNITGYCTAVTQNGRQDRPHFEFH